MKRLLIAAALLIAAVAASAQQHAPIGPSSGNNAGYSQSSQIPNFTPNGGLPHWQTCRANVKANTSGCNIVVIGESTLAGYASIFNEATQDAHSGAPTFVLAPILQTVYGINAQTNSFMGDANTTTGFPAYDTRATINNWFACAPATCGLTFGGDTWVNLDTTAWTFNPTDTASWPAAPSVQSSSVDVYGQCKTGNGTITVSIHGGASIGTVNLNSGASANLCKTTLTTTLAANSYDLVCSGAFACQFFGVVLRNTAIAEASILNGSCGGCTTADWTAAAPTSVVPPLTVIESLAPALCIIQEWGNDWGGAVAIATFETNLTAIASACQQTGDVIFTTGVPADATTCNSTSPTCSQYIAAVATVAANVNAPIWDSWTMFGGATIALKGGFGITSGLNGSCCGVASESVHNSVGAYALQAEILAQILMQ